jgi:hypothetical protein
VGFGFKTADTIAAAVGIARDSPERIKAGLAYTLSEAADDGHCYLPAPNLIADAAKILKVPAELIGPCLDKLAAAEGVVREDVPATGGPAGAEAGGRVLAVYLPPFYQAERSLAHALIRLLGSGRDRLASFAAVDWDKALGWLRGRTGSELAPEQEDAVKLALTSRVAVLTGGPGAGNRSPCVRWWSWPGPRGRGSCCPNCSGSPASKPVVAIRMRAGHLSRQAQPRMVRMREGSIASRDGAQTAAVSIASGNAQNIRIFVITGACYSQP